MQRRNNIYPYAVAFRVSTFCNDKRTSGGVDALVAYGTGGVFRRQSALSGLCYKQLRFVF